MKVIEKNQKRILIEHDNQRVAISPDLYHQYLDGKLTPDDLLMNGVMMSVRWSDFIDINVTAEDIECKLHQHGIHTADDLLKNMQAVNGAIFSALGVTAGTLHKAVKSSKNNSGGN